MEIIEKERKNIKITVTPTRISFKISPLISTSVRQELTKMAEWLERDVQPRLTCSLRGYLQEEWFNCQANQYQIVLYVKSRDRSASIYIQDGNYCFKELPQGAKTWKK